MNHRSFGRIDDHSRTYPAHHFTYLLALLWSIAMDRAFLAYILILAKPAMTQPVVSICYQVLILFWNCVLFQTMTTIQFNHLLHSQFLSVYPVHQSFLVSFYLYLSRAKVQIISVIAKFSLALLFSFFHFQAHITTCSSY